MNKEINNRRPLKTRNKRWVITLTNILIKSKIKPDYISMIGIICALIASSFLLLTHSIQKNYLFLLTAIFIQFRLLCNMLDGMVAVEGKFQSKFGDIFNELPDRFEDIIILVCAGYAGFHISLGWCAASLAVLTSYIRAFGASLGTKHYFSGPMAKPHRMFVLTVACLLEFFISSNGKIITIGLFLIIVGSIITCIRRVRLIVKEVGKR